jgi:sugar/nucleoside kinase (ribokinase family)
MGRSSTPHLVALGDLLLDVVVTSSRPLEAGSDVPGRLAFRRGGSAANVSAAFVRAGGRASLITSLGSDAWADRLLRSLRAEGVRVHASRRSGPSGRLAAFVDARGERSFVTERSAADDLRATDIEPLWLRSADVVHVPAYSLLAGPIVEAATRAAALGHDEGALVSTDLSSGAFLRALGPARVRARLIRLDPDVLFANRDEAGALLGRGGRRAWAGLLEVAPLVVVKDGARGCRVLWRRAGPEVVRGLDVAAQPLGRIDSTGAGDAFAAGFLLSLVRSGGGDGRPREAALRRAALAGHRAAAEALRLGRPEVGL